MISIEKYDWVLEYFRISGRINRKTYILRVLGKWAVSIVALIVWIFIFIIVSIIIETLLGDILSEDMFLLLTDYLIVVFWLTAVSLYLFVTFAQEIKRLHDCNYSGWWLLTRFIPLASIIYLLVLIFEKGTDGENQYGPKPKNKNEMVIEKE